MRPPFYVKAHTALIRELIPAECLACAREGAWLCDSCRAQCSRVSHSSCPFCNRVSDQNQTCPRCRRSFPLAGARALWHYNPLIRQFIHRFKYESVHAAHEAALPLLIEQLSHLKTDYLVTCVPSTGATLIHRGYNQSEVLAQAIAAKTHHLFTPLLTRTQAHAQSQTKLSRAERFANMQNQFTLRPRIPSIKQKTVVILDDVFTTGATLSSCARILRQAGAKEVWGITIAKD